MLRDFNNQELEVGDFIVRAFNLGRCAALKWAKITAVRENGATSIGVTYNYYGDPRVDGSQGNIKYPSRVLKVPYNEVPPDITEIIKEWELKRA